LVAVEEVEQELLVEMDQQQHKLVERRSRFRYNSNFSGSPVFMLVEGVVEFNGSNRNSGTGGTGGGGKCFFNTLQIQ
jgi:hypothetical protein